MKLLLIGDMHIGARNDSLIVAEHQLSVFETEIIPYAVEHGIKTILTCGDVFDRRKFTSNIILHKWKLRVFNVLRDAGIQFITLVGNHDIPWANTLTPNTIDLTLSEYDNITVVTEPSEMELGVLKVLMVPWMCSENEERAIEAIKTTNCTIAFGHFDIIGCEMYRGQAATEGLDTELFKRFETVFSGHYHTKSTTGNIKYLGTPYEMTWIDSGDPKGFYEFDTDTSDLLFIESKAKLFNKLYWDDAGKPATYFSTFDVASLQHKYVKVFVVNKEDPFGVNKLIENL